MMIGVLIRRSYNMWWNLFKEIYFVDYSSNGALSSRGSFLEISPLEKDNLIMGISDEEFVRQFLEWHH